MRACRAAAITRDARGQAMGALVRSPARGHDLSRPGDSRPGRWPKRVCVGLPMPAESTSEALAVVGHRVLGMPHDPDVELRGLAARSMIAEDARWGMDVVLSGHEVPAISGYLPLLLGHHWARIAYEGARALRSDDSYVGVPALASMLQDRYAVITARGRHAAKLVDDTKKGYNQVLSELDRLLEEHHAQLTGNAVRWLRWLESDLGIYYCGGRIAGASLTAAYRLGLEVTDAGVIAGQSVSAVSEEWGATLAVLGAAAFDFSAPMATIDFRRAVAINYRDHLAARYFRGRFEGQFGDGLRSLLLLVEGDLNTARILIPNTASGHEQSAFRARTITLYHALTALQRISERYASLDTAGLRALRDVLREPPTMRLLGREGRCVRNRCSTTQFSTPPYMWMPPFRCSGLSKRCIPGIRGRDSMRMSSTLLLAWQIALTVGVHRRLRLATYQRPLSQDYRQRLLIVSVSLSRSSTGRWRMPPRSDTGPQCWGVHLSPRPTYLIEAARPAATCFMTAGSVPAQSSVQVPGPSLSHRLPTLRRVALSWPARVGHC